MSESGITTLNALFSAAAAHGDRSGNDAHIETLETLLASAWSVMTDEQKAAVLATEACQELIL